ncbi:MAG: hypothetical protein SVY53_06735 [Chloroflexota bacterium]|nr:hypothetical protein [Chloroflexota bacterium]
MRTTKGPRQRIVLNLSTLDIPRDDWKPLTARIEQILYGQQPLIPTQSHIESLAPHYAALLWRKEIQSIPSTAEQEQDWQTVDLSTLSQSKYHTIGEESVSYDAFQHLGLSEILSELGFRQEEIDGTALLPKTGLLFHRTGGFERAMKDNHQG